MTNVQRVLENPESRRKLLNTLTSGPAKGPVCVEVNGELVSIMVTPAMKVGSRLVRVPCRTV